MILVIVVVFIVVVVGIVVWILSDFVFVVMFGILDVLK